VKLAGLLKFDVFRIGLIVFDILVMVSAMLFGFSLVFEGVIPDSFRMQIPYFLGIAISSTLAVFSFLGVYSRRLPQYSERDARWLVLGALGAALCGYYLEFGLSPLLWPYLIAFWSFLFIARGGIGVYASYRSYFFPAWQLLFVPLLAAIAGVAVLRLDAPAFAVPNESLPVSKTVHALYFFFSTSGFLMGRWVLQWAFHFYKRPRGHQARAVLIGADEELLVFSRLNRMSRNFRIVAMLDNDPLRWGVRIQDARIMGGIPLLSDIAESLSVEAVILLKDSLPFEEVQQVETICRERRLRLIRLGSIQESLLRSDSLSTADLLDRKEYRFLPSEGENYLLGRRVLVTGAGGSIGSELVRQILRCDPASVTLLGRGENSIFELERELGGMGFAGKVKPVIVNVADLQALSQAFEKHAPQVVFHAAAHKHVPLMETNVQEALRNNVLGTWNVAELSGKHKVERMVMVSTDKAVAPSSVMGATKAKAEQVIETVAAQFLQTRYSIVRFGNVLGSRGSVVRIFLDQIKKGGPVTVTDPRMTRYFMTIPEAVSLVLATGCLQGQFGVYVLEMGKPYRIADLAEKMIRMCGLEPGRDIRIEFTGVRPGEKLEESLANDSENLVPTEIPSVRRLSGAQAQEILHRKSIEEMLGNDEASIRAELFGNSRK
jgi:FlaA1/EpsC-like NDP-sugar epimerase